MSQPSEQPPIPTFFSERAYDIVRPEASGIIYDPEAWMAVSGLAQSFVRNKLPYLSESAIVFRYAIPGFAQPRDPSIHKADLTEPLYVPDTNLATPAAERSEMVSAQVVMGTGLKPYEIAIKDGDLVGGLIRTLAEPPVDEQTLIASPGAWFRATLAAPSEENRRRFTAQVRHQYAHVIQKVPR